MRNEPSNPDPVVTARPEAAPESTLDALLAIRADMVSDSATPRALLSAVHPNYRDSARNLAHYLALRRYDLRSLQNQLASLGLSSLGRAESCALATVDAVGDALHRLAGRPRPVNFGESAGIDFASGHRLLAEHTDALLGPVPSGREVRIMVTMPSEAGHDYALVRDLVEQGMDCMRVNCAHDDATVWQGMIDNLRRAQEELGKPCRVVMDLAGPKLRTGPLVPGPAVVRIRPQRDDYGRVVTPARVWLPAAGHAKMPLQPAPEPADASIPLPHEWLTDLRVGERIGFTDARGARRSFVITGITAGGCWAHATKTCYILPGTAFRRKGSAGGAHDAVAVAGTIPPRENAIVLNTGDLLRVTRDQRPGRGSVFDQKHGDQKHGDQKHGDQKRGTKGKLLRHAHIGCTIPEVFDHVEPGQPIWFDDGSIGSIVEKVDDQAVTVRITQAHAGGSKLRADKGINLPETNMHLGALTEKDLEDLPFVARHADIVELSFANCARDVELLQRKLKEAGGEPGIVLKIETQRGFENLPEMLMVAMRWPSCGVMIARGDLAVECGFERLAEVQEEILWICEAAHVPAIWATQVLESLAKLGMPSRAEISDAAMGNRAECVMLNKGPYVARAVHVLDDILRRMQAHQAKKRSMLRNLRLARALSA